MDRAAFEEELKREEFLDEAQENTVPVEELRQNAWQKKPAHYMQAVNHVKRIKKA